MATKWCQECEEIVDAYMDVGRLIHPYEWPMDDKIYDLVCDGPFYESAPPELPEGWELMVVEPSLNELLEMELHAEEFLLDLEGALS